MDDFSLKNYNFPKLNPIDIAFSTTKTDDFLLEMAKQKGFYNGYTPYNEMFSQLFFNGLKPKLKSDISEEFKNGAVPYLNALMMSFEPKLEEKEAVCALILSELCEV